MKNQIENALPIDQKVPLKEKLFFGAADLYGGGAQALITAVYLVFLLLNGLEPFQAGLIILIARLWDAVSDPLMGIISDNTRTKWGRRRPYIFVGGFMVIVSFALLFMPLYAMQGTALKFMLYLIAYVFYNTLSTMINVPYSSMSTEISLDYMEKTSVNTIRLLFSMASGAISAVVPMLLTERLLDQSLPIPMFTLIMVFVFGVFYGVPLVLCAVKCKVRIPIPEEKIKFSVKSFIRPLKVKPFVYLLMFYLFAYSCMDIIAANIILFADFGIDANVSSFLYLIIIMVSYALFIPLHSMLMKKGVSKPFLFRVGIPVYILGIVFLCLIIPLFGLPDWTIFLACFIIGGGMSGSQLLPWIIFPDVVDAAELQLNDRPTGSFSGLMTFIKKSTSAIAIALSTLVLQFSGYIKPETDEFGYITQTFAQPSSAVWGIRMVIMVPVIIFMIIAFINARKLKLTPERSEMISELLAVRKGLVESKENDSLSAMTSGFLDDNLLIVDKNKEEERFISLLTDKQKANYEEIKTEVLNI